MRRWAVLSCALAALVACSDAATSLTGGDNPTGGYNPVGGDNDASPGDAPAANAPDAGGSVPDAGGDTEVGDAGGAPHDAGGNDAPGDVVVSAPSCTGTFLCDGFETYTGAPGAPWVAQPSNNPGGLLQVDSTKPYSGTKSVHIKSGGGTTGGDAVTMKTTMGLPRPTNHVFGRMMTFLKGPWPSTHIRVMGMQAAPYQGYLLDAFAGSRGFQLESLTDNFGGGGMTPLVTDKWKCVEWEFNAPTGAAVTTHVWIDGTEITPAAAGFPRVDLLDLWVGYTTALKSGPVEMWIDDVALGATRIGCH
jgi:hypothetical protein